MKILIINNFFLTALIWIVAPQACAQSQKVNLEKLAFMQGTWHQKHEWGDMEEFWGPPMGNNMICSFRCVKDGKVRFYEFAVVEQSDSVPVMYLRHFNPGSIGWEEKGKPQIFPLIQIAASQAVFQSQDKKVKLTYERISSRNLDISLSENNNQGIVQTTMFHFSLSK